MHLWGLELDPDTIMAFLPLPLCLPVQVKIHYTVEGDTTVIATLSANIAKLDFIRRGLPGQPEGTYTLRQIALISQSHCASHVALPSLYIHCSLVSGTIAPLIQIPLGH